MTGLPKFVRDQMARTPAPSPHPDADVLTAFAENTLAANERQQVIEHLSTCTDCRDIVFLAQPDAVPTQAVLAPKPRRLTWITWASGAAVVVVVASAVLLQHEQVTKTQMPVTVATTTTAEPEAKSAAPTATTAAANPTPAAKTRTAAPRQQTNLDAAKTKPADRILTGKDLSGNEEHAYMKAPIPAATPAPVATQQVIISEAAPQQVQTGPEQRNIAGQAQPRQGLSNTANNANIAIVNDNLAKAEPAPPAKVAKKQRADALQGTVTGYAATPTAAPVPAARAHWQISAAGLLERSYTADNWTPVLAETGAKFHVVSVIGNTVWAGGAHGALYVSHDGGATWNSVAINTTATITSIHFSDDSQGTLETADGQVWKTSDGGRTWQ